MMRMNYSDDAHDRFPSSGKGLKTLRTCSVVLPALSGSNAKRICVVISFIVVKS